MLSVGGERRQEKIKDKKHCGAPFNKRHTLAQSF